MTPTLPTCANSVPTFALQIDGGAYNGKYLYSIPFVNQGVNLATAGSTVIAASAYTLTGTTLTEYTGYTLATPAGTAFTYAEFRPATQLSTNGGPDIPAVCAVANGQLTCAESGATQAGICNISGAVTVFTLLGCYPSGFGCTNVVLNVIPLCTVSR